MIEKFNFYDVYGYFLPGFVFLMLIWLPFGLIEHLWPAKELSSAVAAIVFAYIVGHLLQTLAHSAMPSLTKDSQGRARYPSDVFLDSDNLTFSPKFKTRLSTVVMTVFEVDLAVETPAASIDKQISTRRQDAFFSSRGVLIKQEIATYAEQFEGMYALMRGLAIAFVLGFFYVAGWAVSNFKNECFRTAALVTIIAGLVATSVMTTILLLSAAQKTRIDRANLGILMLVLLGLGYRLGLEKMSSPEHRMLLWVIALLALFSFFRCFGAYKFFAQEFAKAVWRDFTAYMATPVKP